MSIFDRMVNYNIKKYKLTPLETIVFRELLTNKSYKQIAHDIYKSYWTVKKYAHIIYDKFGIGKGTVKRRIELLSRVLQTLSE